MLDAAEKKKIRNRLARVAGQIGGIQRMVEEDRYCVDVLLQVAAVRSALAKVAELMLESHVESCVADTFERGSRSDRREKLEELFDVFNRFGKL